MGNVQWETRHGITDQFEIAQDIMQTPDTGYFAVGVFNSHGQEVGYYFLKTDSVGLKGCEDYLDPITVTSLVATDSIITVTDSLVFINQYPAYVHDTTFAPADSLPGCIADEINQMKLLSRSVVAFPNPSTGSFHISLSHNQYETKDIFIYDLAGREISSITQSSKTDFDFTLEAKGIYLVKVLSKGKAEVIKVVVI